MKIKILLFWFGIILTASLAVSAQEDSALGDQDCPLITAEEAIDRALDYTDFDGLPGFMDNLRCAATLGTVADNRTPFVAEYMKNNQVWKLDFIDVELVGRFGKVNRDFEIILDAFTGQLLSVFSISDEVGSSDTLPEPSADVAEQFLRNRAIHFDSLPNQLPKATLIEAFTQCTVTSQKAKLVRAFYINYHTHNIDHNDTWVIILRGTEIPMEAHGPGGKSVPIYERNSLLYSIDSETCLLEYFINAPQDIDLIKRMKGYIE